MRVDWHIHTVLSPCGSLDMSPAIIFEQASLKGLDLIGICDHNSTRQARYMAGIQDLSVKVLPGVELNSKEEIHCLAFFDDMRALDEMQKIIDHYLPEVKNKPQIFGDQVVANLDGKIIYVEENLLHLALNLSFEDLIIRIRELKGLIIPAHANKACNSLLSQLGLVPVNLDVDAVEVIGDGDAQLRNFSWVRGSDAHYPEAIGKNYSHLELEGYSISELQNYLRHYEKGKWVS